MFRFEFKVDNRSLMRYIVLQEGEKHDNINHTIARTIENRPQ